MVATATRRFTLDEYHRLAALGILHEDSHAELIRGIIYNKFPPEGGDSRPYRFTREQYAQMVAAGILTEGHPGDGVEITDKESDVAAMGTHHQTCIIRLTMLLATTLPPGFLLSPQNPVRLLTDGEPEPDFAVFYDRDYDDTPTQDDTLFIIEVADSTLHSDRRRKIPLYAEAGIPEVWLVDVNAKTLERYTEPHDGQYMEKAKARVGESLASTVVPGIVIPVADVLR